MYKSIRARVNEETKELEPLGRILYSFKILMYHNHPNFLSLNLILLLQVQIYKQMEELKNTTPYFNCCIRSNSKQLPSYYEKDLSCNNYNHSSFGSC